MRKILSLAVALAMVLSVVPMMPAALAAGTSGTLFDAAEIVTDTHGDLSPADYGWHGSSDGVKFSSQWSQTGTWNENFGAAALMFFREGKRATGNGSDQKDEDKTASFGLASASAGASKITIEYNFAMQSVGNNYQTWTFKDLDDKTFAAVYYDQGVKACAGTAGSSDVVYANGKDNVYALRGTPMKIEAVKGDAGWTVTYTSNGSVVKTENIASINGFASISANIGRWNDQYAAMALQGLKITFEADKVVEVAVNTTGSDGASLGTDSFDAVDGAAITYPAPDENKILVVGDKGYFFNAAASTLNVTAADGAAVELNYDRAADIKIETVFKTLGGETADSGVKNGKDYSKVGQAYEYKAAPPAYYQDANGAYYIYNAEESTLKVDNPTVGGENTITLMYKEFEGTGLTGSVISEEGATCWFADPRSLTVKNDDGSVSMTYVGYIDNHGSVKATQYDNNTGAYEEVLVRSNFQPDDHNNPTFLELPDHRIMIFYSRHTDEACFYYRISKLPYDITTFGDEKHLATMNNTTYPNPFILSADPDHIYLCWRGINWHPTLGRLTMPDENDNVTLTLEKQIVKSTLGNNIRPYAKYTTDGESKIWITYTGTHPDNVGTNPLYCNYIDITDLTLHDVNGQVLKNLEDSDTYTVSGTETASNIVVDRTNNVRDWVWEIVLDDNKPVIAMVKISSNKKSHDYWYARYTGEKWQLTDLPDNPAENTFFHQSPQTENCYSGGMTIDKTNPHEVYVSMPVNGAFGKVFEIVKFTLNEDYTAVVNTEYITKDSRENNVRPYLANGSAEGDLRLTWMNGQYFYWINDKRNHGANNESGFPTRMMTLTGLKEQETVNTLGEADMTLNSIVNKPVEISAPTGGSFTVSMLLKQSNLSVGGTLFKSGNLSIGLEKQTVDPADYAAVAPKLTVGDKTQKSDNLFSNSDWFSWTVSATGGEKGVNSMGWINYAVTYDADSRELVTYVNGLIDATLQDVGVTLDDKAEIGGIRGVITGVRTADKALTQAEIKKAMADIDTSALDEEVDEIFASQDFEAVTIPTDNITTDLVLPSATELGKKLTWTSSDTAVISANGAVVRDGEAHTVTMTVESEGNKKEFTVTVAPKIDVEKENLLFKYDFSKTYTDENGKVRVKDVSGNGLDGQVLGTAAKLSDGKLDLTANTAAGWTTNGYINVPYNFLDGVRSYTVVQKVKAGSSVHPRLYDFGRDSYHSMFTRANVFSAGIKNDSTQLIDSSKALPADKEVWVVTSYNAATGETRIYLDGELVASDSTKITHEPYAAAAGSTTRNYIGRTQWWAADNNDTAKDNQDFNGTIDNFMFFNAALTEDEIAKVTAEPELSFTFDGSVAKVENAGRPFVLTVAQYDNDGALIKAESTAEGTLSVTKAEGAIKAKAFLWNSKEEMKPIAEAIEHTFAAE